MTADAGLKVKRLPPFPAPCKSGVAGYPRGCGSPRHRRALVNEDSGNRVFASRCCPRLNNFRYRCGHIDSGCCIHPHNRAGNPHGSSSCNRSGLRNSRYNRSLRPDRHKSLCSCHRANGRRGLPCRRGSLLHIHISPPGVASSHHTR